jgi:hypothetical protein
MRLREPPTAFINFVPAYAPTEPAIPAATGAITAAAEAAVAEEIPAATNAAIIKLKNPPFCFFLVA